MWECAADVRANSAVRRARRSGRATAAMRWGRAGATEGLQWEERRAWCRAAQAQTARVLLLLLLLLEAIASCSSSTTRDTAGAEPPQARVPRSSAHCRAKCHTPRVTGHTEQEQSGT